MVFPTTMVCRLLALALVGAHLFLTSAAVPHCHELAAAAGSEREPGHQRRGHHPHRHWAWRAHGHVGHGHAHGASRDGGPQHRHAEPTAPRPAPVDHDQDAVYLVDVFLTVEAMPLGPGWQPAAGWLTVPAQAWAGSLVTRSRWCRGSRPPGDWPPPHHRLLPHVLRI